MRCNVWHCEWDGRMRFAKRTFFFRSRDSSWCTKFSNSISFGIGVICIIYEPDVESESNNRTVRIDYIGEWKFNFSAIHLFWAKYKESLCYIAHGLRCAVSAQRVWSSSPIGCEMVNYSLDHWQKLFSACFCSQKKKMFRNFFVVFLLSTNKNRPHAIRTRNSKRIRFLPNAFLVWIQQSKWITVKYIIKHVWLFLITRSVPNLPAFKYFNWTNWMKKNNVDSSVVWFELVSVYIHFFLFFLSSRSEETNQNQSIEIFWQIFHSNNGLNKTI